MSLASHDARSGAVAMGVAVAASAVAALVVFCSGAVRLPARRSERLVAVRG
jgi:hypothetical protein